MNDLCTIKYHLCFDYLLQEDTEEVHREATVLIHLDQLIKVDREQFKHQAEMPMMREEVSKTDNVTCILRVKVLVQLPDDLELNRALLEVGRLVLDHFDTYGVFLCLNEHLTTCPKVP